MSVKKLAGHFSRVFTIVVTKLTIKQLITPIVIRSPKENTDYI